MLNSQISDFESTVRSDWDGSTYPTIYAPQLGAATSDLFTTLLNPYYLSNVVIPQIQELQALGATGATIHINFPLFSSKFHAYSGTDFQAYVNFYQQVFSELRARGMKIAIEACVGIPAAYNNAAVYKSYLQTLSWDDYVAGRVESAVNVAQLHPDYMSILTEPDSESAASGQPDLATLNGALQLVNQTLQELQSSGVSGIKIGAGTGTWMPAYSSWVQALVGTPIDFLDMHIYPVNREYFTAAFGAADAAHAVGKQVTVSEAWEMKIRDSELGVLSPNASFARDAFSFWGPIDVQFLQTLVDFSQYKQVAFIAPSWPNYFNAYLDYDTYNSLPNASIITKSQQVAADASFKAQFTSTGLAFENMIIAAPDTSEPSVPAPPTTNVGPTMVALSWPSSTDNIGVAGYNVYRDGALLGATAMAQWNETGLSSGVTYSYALQAFDASGNTSPMSAPLTVQTIDTSAPTTPTGLTTTQTTCNSVTITWTPSTDNSGEVYGYRILRGTSPSNMYVVANTPTLEYTDSVMPSMTYYYAVKAYDQSGLSSAASSIISVTTPADTVPPTVPGSVMAQAVSATQITLSWEPSTDNVRVANYRVYRGKSPASLIQIGATVSTSYTDSRANASVMYYYSVAAVDIAGNVSAISPVLAMTSRSN